MPLIQCMCGFHTTTAAAAAAGLALLAGIDWCGLAVLGCGLLLVLLYMLLHFVRKRRATARYVTAAATAAAAAAAHRVLANRAIGPSQSPVQTTDHVADAVHSHTYWITWQQRGCSPHLNLVILVLFH
jgi:hypothetical protein